MRCSSGTGRTSWPSSRAARRSAIAAPARRTSPVRSAWPRRSNWRAAEQAATVRACARCARRWRRPSWRRRGRRGDRPSHAIDCRACLRSSRRGLDGSAGDDGARSGGCRLLDRIGLRRAARPSRATSWPRWAIPDEEARGALRFSLGRTTTDAEVEMPRSRSRVTARGRSALWRRRERRARPAESRPFATPGSRRGLRLAIARRPAFSWRCPAASTRRSRPRSSRPSGDEPVGVWMRLQRRRRQLLRVQAQLLLAGRRRGRASSGLPARHPVLRPQPRARVRRRRPAAVPATRTSTAARRARASTATPYVKFGALLGRARLVYDCDAVATGHYARSRRAGRATARADACAASAATRTRTRATSCTASARTSWRTPGSRSVR